jgi:cob(I)alamin adenosyltransferase
MKKRKIRKGDKGITDFFAKKNVSKTDKRIRAVGAVDEAMSFIGLVRSEINEIPKYRKYKRYAKLLEEIQKYMLFVSADMVTSHYEAQLKNATDILGKELEVLTGKTKPVSGFVLPGNSKLSSLIHCARAVCRRAEMECVSVKKCKASIMFLNRLSKFLFYLAIYVD